jgi:hypothetical protein
MSYQLTIIENAGYLHFTVTGENTRENVARYMEQVMQECRARDCRRVLIEERLQGPRLAMIDVFSLAATGSMRHAGALMSMAYVDVHASGDNMHFAENVAVSRAFPVRVFATVAAARQWLEGQSPTNEIRPRSPPESAGS